MKKYLLYIFMGIVSLLSAGCTKADSGSVAIEFASSPIWASVESKAGKSNFSNGDQIGIFAAHLPSYITWSSTCIADFMYNLKLELTSGKWVYSPLMYWPSSEGARLRFYAYYPYGGGPVVPQSGEGYTGGAPYFTYARNEDTDLLVTSAIEQSAPEDNSPVKLDMSHALSQVKFVGKLSKGGVAHVKKVKIYGASKEGKFTFPDEIGNKGTWTQVEGGSLDIEKASAANDGAGVLVTTADEYVDMDEFSTMLIPTGTLDKLGIWVNNKEEMVLENLGLDLQMGKIYTMKLLIKQEEVVLVTSSITDWVPGGTSDVTIIK